MDHWVASSALRYQSTTDSTGITLLTSCVLYKDGLSKQALRDYSKRYAVITFISLTVGNWSA